MKRPVPRVIKRLTPLAGIGLLLLLAAAVAGCGSSPSQPAGSIKVTMTEFKFDPATISVKAGKLTFYLVNDGSTSHDMVIDDSSGKVVAKSSMVNPGSNAIFDVPDLPTGTYQFICDVPGHAESGMKGSLTVNAG